MTFRKDKDNGEGRGDGRVEVSGSGGVFWLIGWLFTIGFAKLSFMQGVYAILLWPWYLGSTLA